MNSNVAPEDLTRVETLLRRLLDPEDLGHAVSAEVRRLVSAELGRLTGKVFQSPPPT